MDLASEEEGMFAQEADHLAFPEMTCCDRRLCRVLELEKGPSHRLTLRVGATVMGLDSRGSPRVDPQISFLRKQKKTILAVKFVKGVDWTCSQMKMDAAIKTEQQNKHQSAPVVCYRGNTALSNRVHPRHVGNTQH